MILLKLNWLATTLLLSFRYCSQLVQGLKMELKQRRVHRLTGGKSAVSKWGLDFCFSNIGTFLHDKLYPWKPSTDDTLRGGDHVTLAVDVLCDRCVTFRSVRFCGGPNTVKIQRSLITTYLVLVITKGYGVLETTIKSQNAFAPTLWCALHKFHGIDNLNARDQTAFCALYSFFLEVQTKLASYEPCKRNGNWRLGLRASFVTRSYREKSHVASNIAGKGLRWIKCRPFYLAKLIHL